MAEYDGPTWLTKCLGQVIVTARWLMAPIYVGLLTGLVLLIVKVVQKLVDLVPRLLEISASDLVLAVLGLVDLSLVANLVLIVVLAGWHGFLDPLQSTHPDGQPGWLALDFSAVKLKLIGSIAVIAAVALLESLMHSDSLTSETIGWQVGILLAIAVVGVLLALMDRLSHNDAKE